MNHSLLQKSGLMAMLLSVCLLATSLPPANAQQAWKVDEKLQGKIKDGELKKAKDVSGIACDRSSGFPRLCLVADDETQGAQIVVLKDGELVAGDFIKLTDAQYSGKPLELDAEGVAYDGGSFYVIGSHGRSRHHTDPKKEAKNNARADATRQIFRITLDASGVDMKKGKLVSQPTIRRSTDLTAILKGQSDLLPAIDKELDEGGLTIEGVAVRNGRLFVGMRSPVLGTDAAVLSVPLSAVFDGQSAPSSLHRLALENDSLDKPRGVRDIARNGDGFLVLAGPAVNPPKGRKIQPKDYSIYTWDGGSGLGKLWDVPVSDDEAKPEALLSLDGDAKRMRVLILFDGPKEGAPTPFEVPLEKAN